MDSSRTQTSLGTPKIDIAFLVRALVKHGASDLHLKVGRPPLFRIHGKIAAAKMECLTSEQVSSLLRSLMNKRQEAELVENLQIDFSFRMGEEGRFRCNIYHQKGYLSAAIRRIPLSVPSIDDLGVPQILKDLTFRPRGLILVTGSTGSGKSTTLAAAIRHINETRASHVLTIEDPIEFVHTDVRSMISQREVGADAKSFHEALYSGLRQDPDVIVIGEMREPIVIQAALTAAETGHLVLSTLHTNTARGAIDRILDTMPQGDKNQTRIQLASSLLAVVTQTLIPRKDGKGRIAACEVLLNSPAIEQCILKNELDRINDFVEQSREYYRMQSLNQDLERLVLADLITQDEALKASSNPDDLQLRFSGIRKEDGFAHAS